MDGFFIGLQLILKIIFGVIPGVKTELFLGLGEVEETAVIIADGIGKQKIGVNLEGSGKYLNAVPFAQKYGPHMLLAFRAFPD